MQIIKNLHNDLEGTKMSVPFTKHNAKNAY